MPWYQNFNPLGNTVLSTAAAAFPVCTLFYFLAVRRTAAWLAAVPGIARDHRWHLFVAELDGAPVGAAGMFVHRGAAALGPGSVMPAFRGRGVHAALIAARLGLALELGCDLAAAWARQDGPSERNLRRLGLDRIWTVHSYRWERDAAPAGGESPLGDETWA